MNRIVAFTVCALTSVYVLPYGAEVLAPRVMAQEVVINERIPDAEDVEVQVPTPTPTPTQASFSESTSEEPLSDESSASVPDASLDSVDDVGAFIAVEDDPLIVDVSSIIDDDGIGEFYVQWQQSKSQGRWSNISSATQLSFTPRQLHVGHQLRVVITYIDGQGHPETLVSPASVAVQNVNDKPTGSPILTGSPREGDSLIIDVSAIADEDGIDSYDVVWQRSTTRAEWIDYPDAVSEVLRLGQEDVGFSYRAVVTYVDGHNTRELLISNPSETVTNVNDPVEGEVVLAGDAVEGGQMQATTSGVRDEDGIVSLAIAWESSEDGGRNWQAVGPTSFGSRIINLDQSLVGKQVRAKVNVIDAFGVETLLYSQPTTAVKNVNNNPVGRINIRRVGP